MNMNTTKAIGQGVAWNTVSTVIGKTVVFANVFLILRYLSVYEYGLSELIFSVIGTMGIVLLPGLSSAITADLAVERARGEFGRMKTIFAQYLSLNVVLSVIAWSILFFGSSFAAHLASNDSIEYFLKIVSFSFLLSPWRGAIGMLSIVEARFFDQSFYSVFEEIVKGLALLFFFFILHQSIAGLLFATVISQLVVIILFIPRFLSAYRVFSHAKAVDTQVFWQIVNHHRKWSIAVNYIGTLSKTIQLWIIRLLIGTEAVGLYAFATGIIGHITSFLPFSTVLTSLLPRFVDRRDEFVRMFKSSIKAQFLITVVLVVGAATVAPVLFWIFPKYNPAFLLMYITLLSTFPAAIATMYTPVFNTLKEQFSFLFSMVWKIFFSAVFLWLGIIFFGVPGMGIAVTLGLVASTIERTIRLRRLVPGFSLSLADLFILDPIELSLLKNFFNEIRTKGLFAILR